MSTLIKKIYEPKFSSACTKSEAVNTSVLSPYILGEVIEDLNKTKSITISLDASNKKRRQNFPNRCVVLFAKLWRSRQSYRI
jgi:hypothetical protein